LASRGGDAEAARQTWFDATARLAGVTSDTNVKEVVRTLLRRKMMISPFCAGSQAGQGYFAMQSRLRLPSLGYANQVPYSPHLGYANQVPFSPTLG
jgi:hypothetical protein